MKNGNPAKKILIVIGIVVAAIICLVLIANLLISTVASNVLTRMVQKELLKKAVNLPFSFTGLSVNPLLGEISVSGLYYPAKDSQGIDMKCQKIKLNLNPADLIGFLSNPTKASFKTVNVSLEKPALQASSAGFQLACNDISIKLDGNISQSMLASLSSGDVLALLGSDQKIKIKAHGVDFAFIALNLEPEVRPLLQKAFDFESADLDITTDTKSGALVVRSERFASAAFEGSMEGNLVLDKKNISKSRITGGKLTGIVKDQKLKAYFLRMSKDQPNFVDVEGDSVVMNVSGTLDNLQLHE